MMRDNFPTHDRRTTLVMMTLLIAMAVMVAVLVVSLAHTMAAY